MFLSLSFSFPSSLYKINKTKSFFKKELRAHSPYGPDPLGLSPGIGSAHSHRPGTQTLGAAGVEAPGTRQLVHGRRGAERPRRDSGAAAKRERQLMKRPRRHVSKRRGQGGQPDTTDSVLCAAPSMTF